MIKHFCDACGDELTEQNDCRAASNVAPPGWSEPDLSLAGRLCGERKDRQVMIQFVVITGCNGVWNKGDLCRYCVAEAINGYVQGRPWPNPSRKAP